MPHVVSVIFFLMSIGFISSVDFKKWPCRPAEFKVQGPFAELSVHLMETLINPWLIEYNSFYGTSQSFLYHRELFF